MTELNQKAGDGTTNFQARKLSIKNSNFGVTAEEARNIATDVFKANMIDLSEKAADLARARAERLIDNFIAELQKRNPAGMKKMINPDMQFALFEAQKEYSRTGDKDLESMLVNILVDRTREDGFTFTQIVLDESLKILPKLTQQQIDILSIIFLCRRVGFNYDNANKDFTKDIFNTYLEYLTPFKQVDISENSFSFEHLIYTGTASKSTLQISFEECLKQGYPNIFSDFELNQITEMINNFNPDLKALKNIWNSTDIKRMEITSVGAAIAHANFKKTGKLVNANLRIWIR
ncbi:hypothetical protein MOE23_06715 [Bacillus haynesii]|uniref:LPO_1073/Vpar_1526 family protein n=1 Tax=Bacillus haynesii TaxID=1925021 RepID=UPI001C23DF3A|nr:LPO_1073/Vpar_1526 family protein [Bacillus haynesii]MBU8684392.1 hypothetical protein [Bacillus haynesii]MCY8579915.1 hypothetical protein [Bacillus haynesii]